MSSNQNVHFSPFNDYNHTGPWVGKVTMSSGGAVFTRNVTLYIDMESNFQDTLKESFELLIGVIVKLFSIFELQMPIK
jgi:hypothetical protein